MAHGWWDKVLRFVGFGPDEEEEEPEVAATAEELEEPRRFPRSRSAAPAANVVNLSAGRGSAPPPFKVLVVEPRTFDDVQAIVDQLKGRRPIILNLENVDKELAQKILNFLHGAIYALGGDTQKVSNGIFFFAPPGVDVANLGRGLSGAAIGGAAFDPTDLAEIMARIPLEDRRGGLFLPAQEVSPRAGDRGPDIRPDWRR